jgi:sodium-dependent dicarboxylate transporter 2/3/5
MSNWLNIGSEKYVGLFLGLVVFFCIIFLISDSTMPPAAKKMAAIAMLMAIWWITEALPIAVTALLPIIMFPILKIMPTADVTLNYGHHLIFLFLGGFIIALTIERWNLHKRIALTIVNVIGTNPRMIVLGFMIATAFLSMWISNTATAMMMIPIGLAVIGQISQGQQSDQFARGTNNFALALMLAIAYSASIGGISTLIGTPPNVVFVGVLKSSFPGAPDISFLQWMLFALPFSLIFLPVAWVYLVFWGAPVNKDSSSLNDEIIKSEIDSLGHMSFAEKATLSIFIITGLLWLFRSDIDLGVVKFTGWSTLFGLTSYVQDSTVAVVMAIVTFIIPSGQKNREEGMFLMDWKWARRVPWGILLLFGGGFALANGFQESGLTQWMGEQLKTFYFLPLAIVILIVCVMATFTTEFASNTAMASTLLPILAGLSIALDINPMILMIPATISCSTAFMLPIATPPNAIVFGSGYIRIRDMVRIGIIMNVIGLLLILLVVHILSEPVFNIDWNTMPSWAK